MVEKTNFRDLIVDHPACRAASQAEYMDGVTYTDPAAWLRSLRPGDTARVYRPFLLGGATGQTRTRRRLWAERAEAVKGKKAKLVSIDPPLHGPKLALLAFEQIMRIAQGRPGKSKTGRPPKIFTEQQIRAIQHHWPPRRGVTGDEAIRRINEIIKPKRVTRGWLYANTK